MTSARTRTLGPRTAGGLRSKPQATESTTVFIGAEGSASVTGTGGVKGTAAGEFGMAFTFDRNGQLQDVGSRAGASASTSLPGNLATSSLKMVATIEKGAPTFGGKLGVKLKGGEPLEL